jgi:molecular chaperone DnaK
MSSNKIIGIDLGTTNSVVAIMEGGKPVVIPNQEGDRTTPSVVAYTDKGEVLVGKLAKNQAITNPHHTVYSIKRFIGRKAGEVTEESKTVPFKVVPADNGDAWVDIDGKRLSPAQISAEVLKKLKQAAENYLGHKVEKAVITVPAYFNDAQRQATKDAGKIAGLDVVRIINEPTAAALAYGLDKKTNEKVAVYDFGGGTFDISILEVGDGVVEVNATNGDTHLGGDDLDKRLMDFVIDEFKKESGIDLSQDPMALQRLKDSAEAAKKQLSQTLEAEINLPFITMDKSGPKHLLKKITRAQFDNLTRDLVDRSVEPVKKCLADAKLSPAQIQEVIMVGGSTRVPRVVETVKNLFNKEPNRTVNPDEIVAVGAAVQGGVLAGDVKDILLIDVTPLSLGVETKGGIATPMITRNTAIPARRKETFTTAADNQTEVEIVISQGERQFVRDNKVLGRFHLTGIPPAPAMVPQIEVAFDIDANGILKVNAKDLGTGKEQQITITASSGLTKEEIEKMTRDAEAHAAEDREKKEEIEARNHADSVIHQADKVMKEQEGKMSEEQKAKLVAALDELKAIKETGKKDEVQAKMEAVNQAMMAIGEAAYKAAQAAGAGAGPVPPPPSAGQATGTDGGVIDAEVVDGGKN